MPSTSLQIFRLLQRAHPRHHAVRQLCTSRRARSTTATSSHTTSSQTQSNRDATPTAPITPIELPTDSLPRYPTISALGFLRASDYIGTMSFAHSGALLAAASGMDILGTVMVGTITAVGGGTIRDAIILGNRPFWTEETEYIYLCLATAATTFAIYSATTPSLNREETKLEFASDSLGVGAFCVIGAMNGVRMKMPLLVCAVCGMATATFGGVVRDVLCRREVRILHSRAEIYATTALAGASGYLAARKVGLGAGGRVGLGVALAVGLRAWAWNHGVRLPVWEKETEKI